MFQPSVGLSQQAEQVDEEDELVPIEPLEAPISGRAIPCETSRASSSAMSKDAKVLSTSSDRIASMLIAESLRNFGDTT
jgi:hypothetical protein